MKNAKNWILFAVVLVGVALALTGLFIAYMQVTATVAGASTTSTTTLFESESFTETSDLSRACMAFAIMTVIFACVTLILAALQLSNVARVNQLKMVTSALSVVCAIIAFVLICVFANDYSASLGGLASATSAPAIGAYLLAIGGIVSGLFGFFPISQRKKSKK